MSKEKLGFGSGNNQEQTIKPTGLSGRVNKVDQWRIRRDMMRNPRDGRR